MGKASGYGLVVVVLIGVAVSGVFWKFGGNTGTAQPPGTPPDHIKVVPCKLKIVGVPIAELDVDLSEVKNLVVEGRKLLKYIVSGDANELPPDKTQPVILVVDKKANKFTYLRLTPHVKEVRLRTKDASEVLLVVKNQEPLQIELWIDSGKDVDLIVEFKDVMLANPK